MRVLLCRVTTRNTHALSDGRSKSDIGAVAQRGVTRLTVLTAVLLVLALGFVGKTVFVPFYYYQPTIPAKAPPLSGTNSITNLAVTRKTDGRWFADFDYFYTGNPENAMLRVEARKQQAPQTNSAKGAEPASTLGAERGNHHVSTEIPVPGFFYQGQLTTDEVLVELRAYDTSKQAMIAPVITLASQNVAQPIIWPDFQEWELIHELAGKTPDEIFTKARDLVDADNSVSLPEAISLLERLIAANPRFDDAYVELARATMPLHWGPEGFHQAEMLLQSALQIRPDGTDAKVLLGFVYTHQGRFKDAESLFSELKSSGTTNLWLWTNWGELLVKEGRTREAIEKYREAIARGPTHDRNDRARLAAYEDLIAMLEQKKDFDAANQLYADRSKEYGPDGCYDAEYARFILARRNDPVRAVQLARQSVDGHCKKPVARETLGMAYYAAWSAASASTKDGEESLRQARLFLPAGPRALYLLATNDLTVEAVRRLTQSGETIDEKDNAGLTALAHALEAKDYAAAKRLIKLGARPDREVGPQGVPLALVPVLEGDVDSIRFLRGLGLDYSKLRFQGATGIELARRSGNGQVIRAAGRADKSI